MATFVIVAKDTDPLGPNEIRAGETIDVNSGDIFIVSASADANINFVSATGAPTNFDIRFDDSNTNNFSVNINEELDAGIQISNGVQLPDVDIDADKSLSVVMTAGDNVSLGRYDGSKDGIDVLTIGDGFTTDQDIKLNGGDNFLTIGDNADIQKILSDDGADTILIGDGFTGDDINTEGGDDTITIGNDATLDKIDTKDGNDTITIGDNLVADDIKSGDGDDAITIGDDATLDNIETKKGDDTITIGDNLFADDIKTGDGNDNVTIGDNGVVDDIDAGKGDDTVAVGDFFTADQVKMKNGDDLVISGTGGSIDDLDGGNGNDTLDSDTNYPNATNFETICFMRGTRIDTETGSVPIETLRVGDRVRTLDHGIQTIRWIESSRLPGHGIHAPVRIAAGALGNTRALWVSQQHRILISGYDTNLHFGEPEVLIAAKNLVGLPGVEIRDVPCVEYFHMLFDRHEIVFSEGIESESFFPGAVGMDVLSEEALEKLYQAFPALESRPESFGQTARLVLKSFEARLLAA